MAKKRKLIKFIFGVLLAFAIRLTFKQTNFVCRTKEPRAELFNATGSDSDDLLFVGVMTAEKYLKTRAKSAFETWGRHVPGKIAFFSSETSESDDVPLVALPGIDDTYPPQKKSFAMLKYMHDNYIDKFEWFLRADDDVYIRTDRLRELLRSVDSRKPWFIGQTGRGNTDEFGLLSLEENENFCMGGPGVILSRETLKRVAPNIDQCLGNLYTSHEDVELGRCVRRFAGVPCTWSYEASSFNNQMQVIFYHNHSGDAAFSGDLKQKEVHRAITMHPVKYPHYMHRVHNYVKGLSIQQYQQEMIQLHRDISSSMQNIGVTPKQLAHAEINEDFLLFPEPPGSSNYLGDSELLGVPVTLNRFMPKSVDEVLEWELIARSLFSHKDANPRRRIGSSLKEGLTDNIREIMELINVYSKQRGRIIDFKEILYGYWRLDPLHGVDLILDMSLTYRKYRGHKMTVPVRRHAYTQQTFLGVELREINLQEDLEDKVSNNDVIVQISKTFQLPPMFLQGQSVARGKYINMIVPLSNRYETFKRFIEMYEDICIKQEELTRLMIVLYKNEESIDVTNSVKLINTLKTKYPNSDINATMINEHESKFSRGQALQLGANFYRPEDLLLFIDVDIIFNHNSLQRIRHNTFMNKTIYFPIVYSLYNNKFVNETLHFEKISLNNKGFWRQFGFGIVSLYKSDFVSLGGFNTSIVGWGMEDVNLFDSAIKSNFKIIRSTDRDLIHVFHPVECDNNLEQAQKDMCLGTKANILGSLNDLQNFYMKYRQLFR